MMSRFSLISSADGRCRERLSGKTGKLQTPNYPNPYPSRSRCSWHIQVPVGYKIKLQFYHFVLEKTHMCTGDVLKVYDGKSRSAEPLGTYCGAMNPFRVESTASNLFLEFKSDRSLNFAGFNATFSAVAIHLARPMTFARTLLNASVGLGNSFQLLCHIKDGSANLRFSWTKNGVKMNKNGSRHNIKSHLVSKKSYLFLSKVSLSDTGVYGCIARDLDMKKNISAYGTLVVKVPAVVDEGPSAVNVNVGNQVLLKCRSSGDPVPKMSWQVNGKPMKGTQTKFNSELKIKAMEDAVVNCSADNGFGMDWRTAKVTVRSPSTEVKPTESEWSEPSIVTPPKNVTAERGDNITLSCAAVGHPKPKIRWLVDGTIHPVEPADDNGLSYLTITIRGDKEITVVRCEAENDVAIDSRTSYIFVSKVEASVVARHSEGMVGSKFILILAVVGGLLLVVVGVILYRLRRKMQLQNVKSSVDAERLQSNPIFEQHSNYYANPKLVEWEVPRNRMEFIKQLGQGNGIYSSIFLGKISPDNSGEADQKMSLVMVKLLKEVQIQDTERESFEKDAIALTKLQHPYVQSLFGVCGIGQPLCLVFEFSELDESLQEYLIDSGRGQCSIHRRTGLQNVKPKLSNVEQISIAKQIASGMEYLAAKGYIHRELCTKNCIIGNGMVVKISNLGFSWKGPNSDYCSLGLLERANYPLRWYPPETLQFGSFAEATDIWSFGVLLWEVYSSGLTPYYGMSDEEVISLVLDGEILPCPKECPKEIYEIMQGCWNPEASDRPRFTDVHERISLLLHGVPV
ncbi:PREDICTED: muscle, skeletal receptor tyrosine protein kinase-like isoform X2 [Acropora digitifera]|uniref:muscle, skeletal receptor tyrosine protein kinase-like isoform X2 n=1 Tax=Acropora digitifera TaxID=70779 RepID=UPI00077AF752|nr:PREDICTED: muscle, skeletal receptor tyrosine protein kinase-like isoform X2 [Acropora digitifera]